MLRIDSAASARALGHLEAAVRAPDEAAKVKVGWLFQGRGKRDAAARLRQGADDARAALQAVGGERAPTALREPLTNAAGLYDDMARSVVAHGAVREVSTAPAMQVARDDVRRAQTLLSHTPEVVESRDEAGDRILELASEIRFGEPVQLPTASRQEFAALLTSLPDNLRPDLGNIDRERLARALHQGAVNRDGWVLRDVETLRDMAWQRRQTKAIEAIVKTIPDRDTANRRVAELAVRPLPEFTKQELLEIYAVLHHLPADRSPQLVQKSSGNMASKSSAELLTTGYLGAPQAIRQDLVTQGVAAKMQVEQGWGERRLAELRERTPEQLLEHERLQLAALLSRGVSSSPAPSGDPALSLFQNARRANETVAVLSGTLGWDSFPILRESLQGVRDSTQSLRSGNTDAEELEMLDQIDSLAAANLERIAHVQKHRIHAGRIDDYKYFPHPGEIGKMTSQVEWLTAMRGIDEDAVPQPESAPPPAAPAADDGIISW